MLVLRSFRGSAHWTCLHMMFTVVIYFFLKMRDLLEENDKDNLAYQEPG